MKRRRVRAFVTVVLAASLHACGKGVASGPSPLPAPTPTVPTRPVTFTAFLDEDGSGTLDASESARIPNVEIVAGSARGRTATLTGQVTLQVPEDTQTLEVTASTLPPFYRPPTSKTISVPTSGTINVAITLPRGSNRAGVYMAFGDSITNGEPEVGDMNGYRFILQAMLRAHFGAGSIVNEGLDGTNSDTGAARISARLALDRPSFTLIHYGTNDWNGSACAIERLPCYTTTSLRSMVQQINATGGHAFLATILPTNTGYDDRAPAERNDWVAAQNAYIRQVADQEGAVLVDLNGAFYKSGIPFPSLFVDHVHPTAPGYDIMAKTWFAAITSAYSKILSDY